ncbi:MAG TPA: cell division ATP-binding protein FtsE, partial [Chloroflexota bacterium]|nr:cell division ATP-binding protein FtsE [Chloroflexota bacterium]
HESLADDAIIQAAGLEPRPPAKAAELGVAPAAAPHTTAPLPEQGPASAPPPDVPSTTAAFQADLDRGATP